VAEFGWPVYGFPMKIRSNRLLIGLVAALAGGGFANSGLAATNRIYVATNGNDAWSGTLMQPNGGLTDGPKASLTGARDVVRTILAQGGYKWPTIVQIAGGTYALTNALTLGLSDSAGSTNPVVYQAAPGAQPVFTGGRRVTGWTAGANGRWTAFVPGAASDTNYFEQLFIDGRRATRALSPNTDYYYVRMADAVLTNRAFGGYVADVALLAALTPAELSNVAVVVYNKWSTSRMRLSAFNATSNWLTFTATARYAFNPGDRYQLENLPAALDHPGEWFLARDGTLTYWPLPGEDMNTAEVIAPRNSSFLQIAGDSANGLFVQNLTFRGLSFQHGQYLLPAAGVSLSQAVSVGTGDEVRALQSSVDGSQPGQVGFAPDAGRPGARRGVGGLHDLRFQPHRARDQPQGIALGDGEQEGGENKTRLLLGAELRGGIRRHPGTSPATGGRDDLRQKRRDFRLSQADDRAAPDCAVGQHEHAG
jgi:hypothetical protein